MALRARARGAAVTCSKSAGSTPNSAATAASWAARARRSAASAVSRSREEHRSYAMLAELNIRPRTQYLARLSNKVGGDGGDSHAPPHHADDTDHGKEG